MSRTPVPRYLEKHQSGNWRVSTCMLPNRGVVAVYEQGPPDAPPLFLYHGSPGGTRGSWDSLARGLADDFHLIAIDYPGHGMGKRPASGFRADPFSFDTVVEDAVAVLDAKGIEKATLMGYSLGGIPALLTARKHPERVSGLVLCSTALRYPRLRSTPLLERIAGRRTHNSHGEQNCSTRIPARVLGRLDEFLRTSVRAAAQAELASEAFDARPWIGEITVPSAVVISGNDSVVGEAAQEELAAALPNALTLHIPGRRGHLAIPFSSPSTKRAVRDLCLRVSSGLSPSLNRAGGGLH